MSERALPDDPADWPDDPYELLGVSPGVGTRDLRRAYHRLIRVYKPEQSPEQFRRIREAYEHLLRIAEWFSFPVETPDPPPEEEPQLLPMPQEHTVEEADAEWRPEPPQPVEEEPVPVRVRGPDEELDELWESAIGGNPAPAYARLVQLHQQYAGRTDLYLRLYWLLTLHPELDEARAPVDWLVQGLLATGLAGPLQELYREEVADKPAEALGVRYRRLLNESVTPGQLADLIERRFQAAVRLRRWDVLAADVRSLGRRFGPGDEGLWLRLLFTLADALAWEDEPEAAEVMERCRTEIARHEYLASSLSHCFDRFDLLREAVSGWRKLRRQNSVPRELLRLLAASWPRPFEEVRSHLLEVLNEMARAPRRWLDHLDTMNDEAPATLALLGDLLDQFEMTQDTGPIRTRSPEVLSDLILGFLPQLNAADYPDERGRLLAFCLREAVAPEEMAEAANEFTGGWERLGHAWGQALLHDWPLRYVCRACRLFGS